MISTQVPFSIFVLKVHRFCNFDCPYCYYYKNRSEQWWSEPAIITEELMDMTAFRIGEHVRTHQLEEIEIIFHGGEPLLAGVGKMIRYKQKIEAAVGACKVIATIQTNGSMLNSGNVRRLAEAEITVGVSMDGGFREMNTARITRKGRKPGYDQILRGLKNVASYPKTEDGFQVFKGILCVIDIEHRAKRVYESFHHLEKEIGARIPRINFLLPHANHVNPPPMPRASLIQRAMHNFDRLLAYDADQAPKRLTPYGDWINELFDCWLADDNRPEIPLFEALIGVNRMGDSSSDEIGISPSAVAVVEVDGSIEQDDDLQINGPDATSTGLNVVTSRFDEALQHPGILARQSGTDGVPTECGNCVYNLKCGGGNPSHRLDEDGSYDHPTVYCDNWKAVFPHVAEASEEKVRLFKVETE